ncbi:GNAT family N-acetyltransferase [Actinoplanes missouriensis]|uniref:GNAT family N-acetyltransferase n=1 Tax=Actinoplanes missouriensis TaxID=1866 RepID=UPI0018D384D8|nr:GNAT family N-acetyltransferase [Actinoplanes missouriensis]
MSVRLILLHDPAANRLAWLASGPDGRPLGTAFLRVPTGGVADLEIRVHPAERRAGVGTRLLDAAVAAAEERGLPGVLTEAVPEGSDAEAFYLRHGLRRVLSLSYTRLDLAGTLPDVTETPGYRLAHWEGVVPPELAETFARSRRAMDDMPMDDAGYVPQPWDVARLHAVAEAVARRGETLRTTAAIGPDGEIAGFTEVVVGESAEGQHYGTGVLPEHRGRGLARWMKAAQIRAVRERFPRLTGLLADTADSNAAMRRVNASLGYVHTHRSRLYQKDLPCAPSGS